MRFYVEEYHSYNQVDISNSTSADVQRIPISNHPNIPINRVIKDFIMYTEGSNFLLHSRSLLFWLSIISWVFTVANDMLF